jgi:hypothetical protein
MNSVSRASSSSTDSLNRFNLLVSASLVQAVEMACITCEAGSSQIGFDSRAIWVVATRNPRSQEWFAVHSSLENLQRCPCHARQKYRND